MRIERNVHNVDDGDIFYVEPHAGLSPEPSKKRGRRIGLYILTVVIVAGIAGGIVKYQSPKHFDLKFALQAMNGKVALTASQLHDVVVGEGLNAYWLGPEDGALYALNSVTPTQTYVRYLPGGAGLNDSGANFRVVGTYEAKDAFLITQNNAKSSNGSGFINSDGNAVYTTTTHPLSAYVGVKNTDDQIEIFDPTSGQALVAVRTRGMLQKIR